MNANDLTKLLRTSESFQVCLKQILNLSFTHSTTLIDCRILFELLSICYCLDKLDLSYLKFFFLSNNFSKNNKIFPSIKRLNLNGNALLSDYAFNYLLTSFPNLQALHLLNIPLRSSSNASQQRTFLTFENLFHYLQKHHERFEELTISFEPTLPCDSQIKRLFSSIPLKLTYFHIDGTLSISTLQHFLLLLNNHLETLIVGRLILDHTGCEPLFTAINQFATKLKKLCVFLNVPSKFTTTQVQKKLFPHIDPTCDISLSSLEYLQDLDIQTLHPLNENDLIYLLNKNLFQLKKLALPRNTTDDVIKSIAIQSSFASKLTHLNLNSCSSLSNRSILFINKYCLALEELLLSSNININDFAFIGISICGIGKSIEWLDETLINRHLIDDVPIWTYTVTHQNLCKCQLPEYISSACIKLRLRDFNFEYDESSDRILSLLVEHKLCDEYFPSINQLKHLKTLKLRECVQITNRLFRFGLRSLSNLKYLDMNSCEKINDKNLSLIGRNCPTIETIDISGCHRISEQGKQILKTNAKRVKIIEF